MNDILKRISAIGIVPVIKIDDAKNAVPLAKALRDGGLPCAEITFRTEQAEEAISLISAAMPDMLLGAGTVLTTQTVVCAVAAGAKFIVTPGFNPKVVGHCVDRGIPVVPGCSSPTDIERAIEFGLSVVKFFPAQTLGGIKAIKAMSAPYPQIQFMPTGGIDAGNLREYLDFSKVAACGGSWMVKEEFVLAGEFNKITALTKEAIASMLGFELAHVGINTASESEAEQVARLFSEVFALPYRSGGASDFAGNVIEVMKSPALGKYGHIAISTNSIERALSYLQAQGWAFDIERAKYDAKGRMLAVYFKNEFGGFAVHLLQKK